VFIHRLLERMAVPVIWTANDICVLGPKVLRRMTMCVVCVMNLASALLRDSFLRLGREQQRIAIASTGVCRSGCFGFRHVFWVDGDYTRAAPMSGHHHSQRLVLGHAKFRLQNRDDEPAMREIIIDQDDFMQPGPFDLYLILDLGLGDGVSHGRTAFMGHGSCASACIVTMIRPKQHTALARPL
jgi:hypothetical protein